MKNKIYNLGEWGFFAPTKEQFILFLHKLGITDEFIGIYENENEDDFGVRTETFISVFSSKENLRKIEEQLKKH